ncbi:LytR C-terminal domain-containing protein [Tessaracoccus sp. HDW20]|uniref:LytR C-terminal domain-containing protein n=1 Tax=Tessaracoccus coleopterorum TaxID=2714950 RepID=UPI0018D35F7A|nr:LytR C-terminal domain-containing protein [Tessaracoccus coleopterorum]
MSVRIFNGGYTTGQAQRVQTRLVDFGYNVLRIANTEEQIKVLTIRANRNQARRSGWSRRSSSTPRSSMTTASTAPSTFCCRPRSPSTRRRRCTR